VTSPYRARHQLQSL